MDIAERVAALEQKVAALDNRVSTVEGQFDFVSRQLRDLHLFVHGKFGQIDRRFDKLEAKVDAMPRAIIEALREERR